MATARRFLDSLLSWTLIGLMVTLTVVVIVAVIYRKAGASLPWYDEIASVMLAWITYYGSALAALRRGHIGFDGVLLALPIRWRAAAVIVAEVLVIGFFIIMAWAGWEILKVLEGSTLVSLTWMPIQVTQSVIPIGAVLFIIAELLSIPPYWAEVKAGISSEHPPMVHEQAQER
ncbi:MAG: TRAP transporter small permease [Rhodomicrobium sp.]|nr:TRAP transporter small permease [Rhodomicrobium sp.]